MKDSDRELLLDAFTAGWQAALSVTITHPRVLAVIESCFEGWLVETTDEVEVFGLSFRRREDLPKLVHHHTLELVPPLEPEPEPDPAPEPEAEDVPVAAFQALPRPVGLSPHLATKPMAT